MQSVSRPPEPDIPTTPRDAEPATAVVLPPRPNPSGPLGRLFLWYLRRANSHSNRRLIAELVVLSFALKFVAVPFVMLLPDSATSNSELMLDEMSPVAIAIAALVVAPLLETLVFQWFLLWLCSRIFTNWTWRIVIPSIVFALLHLPSGALTALSVFFPGVVFTLGFAAKRMTSRWSAFWTTSAVHALHNALALALAVLARGL